MATSKSIEVKVGFLILVALVILGGFLLVLGGVNFEPTYKIYVDFDNPGGLQIGAPVKIAGVAVGNVREISFRAGSVSARAGQRDPLVRLGLGIQKRYKVAVRKNATFFVTAQGVLGEQFLAIDPGSMDQPELEEGSITRALDPPRFDMLLAEAYDLLHSTVTAMRNNREEISEAFMGLRQTLRGTGHFFEQNRDRMDRIAENMEKLSVDVNDLLHAARDRYVDNPQITRIIGNVDKTTASLARDSDALLADSREVLSNAKRLSAAVGSEQESKRLQHTLSEVSEIVAKAKIATNDAQSIVAHIKKGDGSIGNMVMSEQLYDDVQELARDLKHNPWKLFWKE